MDSIKEYRNIISQLSGYDFEIENILINEAKAIGINLDESLIYIKNLYLEEKSILYIFTNKELFIFNYKSEDKDELEVEIFNLNRIESISYRKNRHDKIYALGFNINNIEYIFDATKDTIRYDKKLYAGVVNSILQYLMKKVN